MLKLNETTRDEIVKIVANSTLPTNIGLQIINVLNNLEKEVPEKANDKATK